MIFNSNCIYMHAKGKADGPYGGRLEIESIDATNLDCLSKTGFKPTSVVDGQFVPEKCPHAHFSSHEAFFTFDLYYRKRDYFFNYAIIKWKGYFFIYIFDWHA